MTIFLLDVKLGRIVLPPPPPEPPAPPVAQPPAPPSPSEPSRSGCYPSLQRLNPPLLNPELRLLPSLHTPQPSPSRPGGSPATQAPTPQPTPSRPRAPSSIYIPPATPTRSVASLSRLPRASSSLRSLTSLNFQSPQRLRAPVLTAWQEIALSDFHKELVTQIIETHQNMGYYGALRGDWNVASL